MSKILNLHDTSPIDELAWPEMPESLSLDSPAEAIFTDFRISRPLVIEGKVLAAEAEKLMMRAHVRMKFVVDENNHYLGVLDLEDLSAQERIKKIHGSKVVEDTDIYVTDMMKPREEIKAISYEQLSQSTIGDVVETLKENGQQHCLVIDEQAHLILGLISASEIARKMHLAIDIEKPTSFLSVFSAINS